MDQNTDNVVFISDPKEYQQDESLYIEVRSKEGRILADEQVIKLPDTLASYKHHKEWNLRTRSFKRLTSIVEKKKPSTVLDVGCGNGWLIGRLSTLLPKCQFTGADLNKEELKQAGRIFKKENTQFYYVDLMKNQPFQNHTYDVIIFNASIQYFQDLAGIIKISMQLLKEGGVIIINDSPFYQDKVAANLAAKRSEEYYNGLSVPEMSIRYFHHTSSQLLDLGFDKHRDWTRLLRCPFPLYIFRKDG